MIRPLSARFIQGGAHLTPAFGLKFVLEGVITFLAMYYGEIHGSIVYDEVLHGGFGMYWGFKRRFELYGVPPQQYIMPPSLSESIENLVSVLNEGSGSVIIAGPLGAGKTSLLSYLGYRVQRNGVEVLSAQAVGSLGYLTEQFVENIKNGRTFREFWKKTYGLYVPTSGGGRSLFSRLMKCMKFDSEKRGVKYVLAIDEFKPLLWARSDIRRTVIEHLAHVVNDRNGLGDRYANLMLTLIQRPDQDSEQVFDQMLTISTRKTSVERSAFERRFREILSLFYNELDISIIASSSILYAKGINPDNVKENDFLDMLKPFSFEALMHAARMSGRNPGFCMLLLDDALKEAEKQASSPGLSPEKIEINEDTIDLIAKKRFEREGKRLTEEQVKFLQFLETPRRPDEVALQLNTLKIPREDVEVFISDLQRRGLIEKTKDDLITTTMLWLKGSKYSG